MLYACRKIRNEERETVRRKTETKLSSGFFISITKFHNFFFFFFNIWKKKTRKNVVLESPRLKRKIESGTRKIDQVGGGREEKGIGRT